MRRLKKNCLALFFSMIMMLAMSALTMAAEENSEHNDGKPQIIIGGTYEASEAICPISTNMLTADGQTDSVYSIVKGMNIYDVTRTSAYTLPDNGKYTVIVFGNLGETYCTNTVNALTYFEKSLTDSSAARVNVYGIDIATGNTRNGVSELRTSYGFNRVVLCNNQNEYYNTGYTSSLVWKVYSASGMTDYYLPFAVVFDGNDKLIYASSYANGSDMVDAILESDPSMEFNGHVTLASKTQLNQQFYDAFYSDAGMLELFKESFDEHDLYSWSGVVDYWVDSDDASVFSKAKEITKNCSSDYEKIKAVHDWIAANVYYDYKYLYYGGNTPLYASDVLKYKYSVCQGYADLACAMLRSLDIPCLMITGYVGYADAENIANKETNHAWNAAYANGRWVIFDTTWDSGNKRNTDESLTTGTVRDTYFDPDMKTFSEDHLMFFSDNDVDLNIGIPGNVQVKSVTTRNTLVTFDKARYASYYYVYRKEGASGNYVLAGSTSNTKYTDTTAKDNTQYYYKVCAVNKKAAGSFGTEKSVVTATTYPTLSSAAPINFGGIKVTWKSVAGAANYNVYRRENGGTWAKVGTTTGTSYSDKTTLANRTYFYTVKAVNKYQVASSCYKIGVSALSGPARPVMYAATAQNGAGIKASWYAAKGAAAYNVYRKTANGSWTKIGSTVNAYYTDKTCLANTKYFYTVRAINKDGTLSGCDSVGKEATSAPGVVKLVSAVQSQSSVAVKWNAVSGAAKYNVYRKTSDGSWAKIGESTSTSYTDKSAVKGKTYLYTIKAVNSAGISGNCDTSGISVNVK